MIPYQRKRSRTRRGNGYVLLDSTWAKRLGPTGRALKPPFAADASTEQFRKICEQHSRVIPVPGAPAPALTEQGERR
jgi:hypothetical protein